MKPELCGLLLLSFSCSISASVKFATGAAFAFVVVGYVSIH